MPLQINTFNNWIRLIAGFFSVGSSIVAVSARPIDKTLIESAILINHEELTDPGPLYVSSRIRRAAILTSEINAKLEQNSSRPLIELPSATAFSSLEDTMQGLFNNHTNDEIKEGVKDALIYIRDQRGSLGLDTEQIGKATQALVQAALEASADRVPLSPAPGSLDWNASGVGTVVPSSNDNDLYRDYLKRLDPTDSSGWTESFENSDTAEKATTVRAFLQIAPEGLAQKLPSVVIETFISSDRAWTVSVPDLTKSLAEGMARGTMTADLTNLGVASPPKETLMRLISEETVKATLKQIEGSNSDPKDIGFYPGIDPILPSSVTTGENVSPVLKSSMKLDGEEKERPHFHPDKTRVLEYATNGLAYGALAEAKLKSDFPATDVPLLAQEIGSGAAKGAVDFMSDLSDTEDHSLFTYEVVKSIASGTALGSIMVSSSHQPWKNEKIPERVAEKVAYGVASAAVESSLINKEKLNKIARIGEAAAFGSSQGAQFATVFDPDANNYSAWDYDLYGKKASYDRIAIAEATSKGSAAGAIEKAADTKYEGFFIAEENNSSTRRQEILNLARGTTMGSVLSNVAMAVYYDTNLQSMILASSKGSAYGSITAGNLYEINKPLGVTEEFEVEIARASANGATTAALFEVVVLLDAKPDSRRADFDSIASAKSASYGSTLGAILGGDKAGQDSVAIKQATEQGATEGSLDGVALALGFDVAKVDQANLKSERAIKNAVAAGNTQAATKAAAAMSTKSIRPSASNMLLLMQKYNISPSTTNPGFVFPNPKKKGEEDFLFDEKFPVASPI
jgi:hypothetical protein